MNVPKTTPPMNRRTFFHSLPNKAFFPSRSAKAILGPLISVGLVVSFALDASAQGTNSITVSSSTAVGIGLAAAANYKVAKDSQWKDYEDVLMLATLNGVAKAAANNGQSLTTASYIAVANQLRAWLNSKSPQNPVFADEAACLRYTIDSMVPIVNAGPASPLLPGVLNGLENLKLTQLEIPIDPTRQYPADLGSSSISPNAYQFIADRVQEASDLAHNDAQYAAAVNPVIADLLAVDSTASYAQIQSLYPSALPNLPAPNTDGSFTFNPQDLVTQYQSIVTFAQCAIDNNLGRIENPQSVPANCSALATSQALGGAEDADSVRSAAAAATKSPVTTCSNGKPVDQADNKSGVCWSDAQSAITGLSKLESLSDSNVASQIVTVGTAVVQAGTAISALGALSAAGGAVGVLPVLGPVGAIAAAGVAIYSVFASNSSSNANAAVLQQIQKLSQQIARFQQDVTNRFNQVDATLNTILTTLNQDFALINYQLGVLNGDAHAIQVGLLDVQTQLNQLAVYALAYAQTQEYETLVQYLNGCLNYRTVHNGADIDLSQYNTCENQLFTWANNNVTDQLWAGVQQPDYSDGNIYNVFLNSSVTGVCSGCASPFSTDVNYLAQFPVQNLGLPALAPLRLPNPEMWTLVARAYLQLAREWPQYAVTINSVHFDDLIQVGTSLQQAIHKGNSAGSGAGIVTNQMLFNAVVNKYNAAIGGLQTAIQGDLNTYVAGLPTPNGISLNLFGGGANQHASWRPSVGSMGFCSGAGETLTPAPSNLFSFVPDIFAFAQGYFSLGSLTMCISNVQWVGPIDPFTYPPFEPNAYAYCFGRAYDVPLSVEPGIVFEPNIGWVIPNLTDCTFAKVQTTVSIMFNGSPVLSATATTSDYLVSWFHTDDGMGNAFDYSVDPRYAVQWVWLPSNRCGYTCGDMLAQLMGAAAVPQATPQLLNSVAAQIDAAIGNYQHSLYANIASHFGAATPVQSAGQFLSGTKLLSRAYANFGLPGVLQTSDGLHGLLYGSGSIPDASAVQSDFTSFSTATISNTTDNKIVYEIALLNSRSAALAAAFTGALGQVQQSGVPDSLAQVDTTLTDLQAFETIKNAGALSPCVFQLSSSFAFVSSSGGTPSVGVQVPSASCSWRASTGATWLTIMSGQAGSGQGTVNLSAAPNTSASARSGIVIVGDQIYKVFQNTGATLPPPGQFTLILTRNKLTFGTNGSMISGPQSFAISITGANGINWTASSNQTNVTVVPPSGTGNASIQVSAMAGPNATITVTAPGAMNSPQQVQVNILTAPPTNPYGSFDTPANNTAGIAGAIPVTGWALDNIGVTNVGIFREPIGNESLQSNGLVYVGNATFVEGARPDVETAFPNAPLNYRGGWGYMLLTNFLPSSGGATGPGNGAYKLHAIATNMAGNALDLGTRTIIVDNAHASKPFGTIDTPSQGGTASGNAYVNFGWALTQNPYCIPKDGSTITVYIDSSPVGHPTYNQFRIDIATFFPGLCNTNGAAGFFYIDTTKLSNGVHTISWVVYDNGGRGDGIGSRYFTVLNTGTGNEPQSEQPIQLASNETVTLRRGFDVNREIESLKPDPTGDYSIEIEELERLELQVGATEGYLQANGEQRPLPIGSSLKGGVFCWHAGPGFLGEYQLLFARPDGTPIQVRIRIRPKMYLP